MIIIYGHRAFGRVDEYGGEYVQTSFAHVYFMPLVPTASMWVTREGQDGSRLGLEIPLDGKSVLAAYLRTWGLVGALAAFFITPGLVSGLVALGLLALSLYSWTWRGLRGVLARKRSDFNLLAYGTRCEPAKMPSETRVAVTAALEGRHATLPEQRPVEDIARFGARDLDEAVIAYGLLRLAAISHRDPQAEAAADRLVAGSHDTAPTGEGPYREIRRADDARPPQALVAEVAGRQAAEAGASRASGFLGLPGMKLILLAGLALFSAGMIATNSEALFGCDEITYAELATTPPYFKYVAVTCDSTELFGHTVRPRTGSPAESVFRCYLGDHTLVVTADPKATTLDRRVEGRIRKSFEWRGEWPAELDEPSTLRLYLDAKGHQNDLAFAIAGLVAAAAALGLGGFWLVRFLRARRRS
jgi:hypothetical protein